MHNLTCRVAITRWVMLCMPLRLIPIDYWDKYCVSMGIAEIFSIFLERQTTDKNYLLYLGIDDRTVLNELEDRNRFMELFFLTCYAANSLMKTGFWRLHLDIEHTTELYANLVRQYTGLEVPGGY